MSLYFRLEMFILALVILIFIVTRIRNNTFSLKHSLPWLLVGVFLVFVSIFPTIITFFAVKLGFGYTFNFLIFIATLFLFIVELLGISTNTKNDAKIKNLIQEVSMLKKEIKDEKEK